MRLTRGSANRRVHPQHSAIMYLQMVHRSRACSWNLIAVCRHTGCSCSLLMINFPICGTPNPITCPSAGSPTWKRVVKSTTAIISSHWKVLTKYYHIWLVILPSPTQFEDNGNFYTDDSVTYLRICWSWYKQLQMVAWHYTHILNYSI